MTERKHAALTQQHVVAERKDDRDAHLRHQRQRKALAEERGQHQEQQCRKAPNDPAAKVQRTKAERALLH